MALNIADLIARRDWLVAEMERLHDDFYPATVIQVLELRWLEEAIERLESKKGICSFS